MKFVKRGFEEFKSIFKTENLLKENEEHANIVTASTMLNVFWFCLITWVLVYFEVFKIGMKIMNIILLCSIVLLVIPSAICYLKKGKGVYLKQLLFISFVLMVSIADAILKYNVTLIMVLPVILAARYYNKKFTIGVAVLTSLTFIGSAFISMYIGQQDLNSYNLIIPKGTVLSVNGTLRDAVTSIKVNEMDRLKNIFIHFFIPKLFIFNIVAFACAQISQSGKKMMEKQEEITKNGARIETELNLANAIQKSMLPSIFPPFPEHDEVDLYALMDPAKEVGGDFYDMFLLDENHVAICVADVSGKGVPASLVMMISKILIKNVVKIDLDVSKALSRVNNMLCDGNETGLFLTCWFGILNLKSGTMEFVNAGHNPPLLYRNKTGEFECLKTKSNLVLAGCENFDYIKEEIHLDRGDRLFLYTDGVVEASDIDNKQYGIERLTKYLTSHLQMNSKETVLGVKNDIDNFVGNSEQFDDITMLELIYRKKKGQNEIVKKDFNADAKKLNSVQAFVLKELKKYKLDKKTINQMNLAIEEIFVNIAHYAYEGKTGKCTLKVEHMKNNKVKIIFEDNGIKFNPLLKKDPDITLSAKKRKIGGLGIYLTKKIFDDIKYNYKNKKNILTITKSFK